MTSPPSHTLVGIFRGNGDVEYFCQDCAYNVVEIAENQTLIIKNIGDHDARHHASLSDIHKEDIDTHLEDQINKVLGDLQ